MAHIKFLEFGIWILEFKNPAEAGFFCT